MSAIIIWGLLSFAHSNTLTNQCDFLFDGRIDIRFLNYGTVATLNDSLDRKVCSFSLAGNENKQNRGRESIISKFIPIEKCKVGQKEITYISTRAFLTGKVVSAMDITTNVDSHLNCKKKEHY